MKQVLFFGIDPGKSGAIAAVDQDGRAVGHVRLSETEHDVQEWLRAYKAQSPDCRALLEEVHSRPGEGVRSVFTFGTSYGFVRGLLVANALPFATITPVQWQTRMKCRTGGDKNISKAAAQRLWPSYKMTRANADAFLLAELCRHIYQGK